MVKHIRISPNSQTANNPKNSKERREKIKMECIGISAFLSVIAYTLAVLIFLPIINGTYTVDLSYFYPYYIESLPFYLLLSIPVLVEGLKKINLKKYSNSVALIGWSLAVLSIDIVIPAFKTIGIVYLPIIFGVATIFKSYKTQFLYFLGILCLLSISLFNIGYPTSFVYAEPSLDFSVTIIVSFIILYVNSLYYYKSAENYEELLASKNIELSKHKEILEKQQEDILKLEAQRSNFYITTAHELRTPLTLIIGPLKQLIESANLRPSIKNSLKSIQKNGEHMKDLLTQLLDSAKIENDILKTNQDEFELNGLLVNILESFQPIASHRNIKFQKDLQLKTTQPVKTDKYLLKIIIKNILVNAFKFTEKNDTVLFKAWEQNQTLHFEIKDTGQGIEEKHLAQIFDIFYQSPSQKQQVSQGSGLGLYIVKEYLKVLKGTIDVKSDIGFGTTFTIQVPYEQVDNFIIPSPENNETRIVTEDTSIEQVASKSQNINKTQRLLIVEDSLALNDYIKSILVEKYHIHQVYDGQEALDYLKDAKELPDLIISDVMMPTLDGMALLKEIRQNARLDGVPVIMLTCKNSLAEKVNALELGATDYLTKPFEEEELIAKISNALKSSQQSKMFNKNKILTDQPPVSKRGDIISQEEEEWLQELEQVCLSNIGNLNLTIDDIAAEMNISRAQFFRRVKKLTGSNPGQYLQETRLQQALKLIMTKKYSTVKAVAYSVGFKSDKYFSKKFKGRFGVYPSKYHDKIDQVTQIDQEVKIDQAD